jgi:drug/metabolite transporter (DMT)-like permease
MRDRLREPVTPRTALVSLHAAVALFGVAALFGKWVALPATAIVLGRTAIAAVTLAMIARARGRPLGRANRVLAASGAILALHWVSFFGAVQVASVTVALLGYASFPLFVLLLERGPAAPARRIAEYAVALLATIGMIAIVPDFSSSSDTFRGLALGLVSGFTFALLAVRNRKLVAVEAPMRIALWQNVFAAICLAPLVVLLDHAAAKPGAADVALLIVLGVGCTGLAHTLFIASMRHVSAHAASVVAALEPVYGIALAVLLRVDSVPDTRTLIGGLLIVAAAVGASSAIG